MNPKPLIKNIALSQPQKLADLVEYQSQQVVSRTLAQNKALTVTLFAFDQGEGLSPHSAPGDALVQILDGEASITIGEQTMTVRTGEAVVMPADVPHALQATVPFKMLLTLVKKTAQS